MEIEGVWRVVSVSSYTFVSQPEGIQEAGVASYLYVSNHSTHFDLRRDTEGLLQGTRASVDFAICRGSWNQDT